MSHALVHLASAAALAPWSWVAAVGALVPDLTWALNELRIRAAGGNAKAVIETLPESALLCYRAAHSLLMWLPLACWRLDLAAGAVVHLALDWPTHGGRMRQVPLWPLPWRWPLRWVARRFR